MRAIPNMTIIVPADADEIERAVLASVDWPGPIYFRVAKGGDATVSRPEHGFEIGKAIVHREPGPITFVATGTMVLTALQVADTLKKDGVSAGVINVHTIKPLDELRLKEAMERSQVLFALEEHCVNGGLGSAVAELVAETRSAKPLVFKRFGLPDLFPDEYGTQDTLKAKYGLGAESILKAARGALASL